jgi:hypothetical protein
MTDIEETLNKVPYDRHRKIVRAAKIRAKAKETADYQAAHPEIVTEHNIAITRSWWGQEDGT